MAVPTFGEMPDIGEPVSSLETPAVVIDMDAMERNLDNFGSFARRNGVTVRPHAKLHKSPAVARRQTEFPAHEGILCQTLGEAVVMARGGIDDLVLVCPVASEPKARRVVWLAEECERFAATVDGPGNMEPLDAAGAARDTVIDVVLEVDVGLGRGGVGWGDAAVEPARRIHESGHLRLEGILGHDGHVKRVADSPDDYGRVCAEIADRLAATVDAVEGAGIGVESVRTGSTVAAKHLGTHDVVTEINPGRYVFNDVGMIEYRPEVGREDCAASVVTTVISTPTSERAIVDAGSKTLSFAGDPMPVPRGRDDVEFYDLHSEHGFVDVSDADVSVGDRIEFVVPHVYGAINVRDRLIGARDGRVAAVWEVDARGKDG